MYQQLIYLYKHQYCKKKESEDCDLFPPKKLSESFLTLLSMEIVQITLVFVQYAASSIVTKCYSHQLLVLVFTLCCEIDSQDFHQINLYSITNIHILPQSF